MLAVAELCKKAGAPLQSLRLAQCTTRGLSRGEYVDMVTNQAEAAHAYGPLSSCLHGLTELDLSASPHCGEAIMNAIVTAAPSLTSLLICIIPPADRSTSLFHMSMHRRKIVCTNLQSLKVRFVASSHIGFDHAHYHLRLEDISSLCSCMLDVKGDPRQRVMLSLSEAASVDVSVESGGSGWLLGMRMHPPGSAGRRAVGLVIFTSHGRDGWHAEPVYSGVLGAQMRPKA
jgi:hypothetical protein